jgi:hypothetical protein
MENRSKVTRQDRAITDEAWIIEFLSKKAGMATIATVRDGQPFQSTLLYVYDAQRHAIYFHTGTRGRVWDNLREGGQVCFSAAQMGRLLPAATALNFSVEYQSVVAFGPARLVEDPAEAEQALQMLLDRYFPHLQPGADYRAITAGEMAATAVFRMEVEEWSGKQKAVAEDFPGAFQWPKQD